MQIIDNKSPNALNRYLITNKMTFQLVPPHLHRTNKAENAVGSFKDHLIAGISSVNPSFPMQFWGRLTPLATTTLHLL